MVDSSVDHSSGKKIDSNKVNTDVGEVERQVVSLGDPTNADGMPAVKNSAPAGSDYGLVVRVAGGGGSGGTEYTEDAAADADPIGGQLVARRRDTPAAETDADGDVVALNATNKGELYVKHADTLPVSGPLTDAQLRAAPVPVTGGGGGTEYTEGDTDATIVGGAVLWEDAADTLRPVSAAKPLPTTLYTPAGDSAMDETNNAARVKVVAAEHTEDQAPPSNPEGFLQMARRRDAPGAETDTDGDIVALNATNKGELYVKHIDAVPVTGPLTDTELRATDVKITLDGETVALGAAIPAGTNNIGDVDVLTLPAGTVAGASSLPAGTNNIGDVDVLSLPALPAGSNNIGDVDVLTLPALPAGSNNIGDVDVLSLPALPAGSNNIGDVDVLTQPARAATTDTITAKLATDAIQNGTSALTPKFAIIDAASSGDNTLVAAVSSKKIRVLALFMVAAAAVTVRIESGAGGTALTGQMNLAANGGFVLPFNPVGWFETAATTLLNLELSAAQSVDGCLTYVEV